MTVSLQRARRRLPMRACAAATLSVALVAAAAVPALAETSTPNAPLPGTGNAVIVLADGGSHPIETTRRYWSVVASVGSQGFESDTTVKDAGGRIVGASTAGPVNARHTINWVAIDSNVGRYAPGPYTAVISKNPAATSPSKYLAQFVDGRRTLSTTNWAAEQPVGYPDADNWLVDIRDVYLSAGTEIRFVLRGSFSAMYVLQSDPNNVSTHARTRTSAAAAVTLPAGCTLGQLSYRAPADGWYGVVFESERWSGSGSVQVSTSGPIPVPTVPSACRAG